LNDRAQIAVRSRTRYADTYFSDEWVSVQGLDPTSPAEALVEFERSCVWN
jgi:cysteine synthase